MESFLQVYYFAAAVLHKGGAIPMCLSGSKMDLGETKGESSGLHLVFIVISFIGCLDG